MKNVNWILIVALILLLSGCADTDPSSLEPIIDQNQQKIYSNQTEELANDLPKDDKVDINALWIDNDGYYTMFNEFSTFDGEYIYYTLKDLTYVDYGSGKLFPNSATMHSSNAAIYRVNNAGGEPELLIEGLNNPIALRENKNYLYFRMEGCLFALDKETLEVININTLGIFDFKWHRFEPKAIFTRKYAYIEGKRLNMPSGRETNMPWGNEENGHTLTVVDDWVYYTELIEGNNEKSVSLYRIRENGEDNEYLANYNRSYNIFVFENSIFTTKRSEEVRYWGYNFKIIRYNLDTEEENIIYDGLNNDNFPYIINVADGWIYYTYFDGTWESFDIETQTWKGLQPGLYRMKLDGSNQMLLSFGYIDNIEIAGDWVFFTTEDPRPSEENMGMLVAEKLGVFKMKKDGSELQPISEIVDYH